MASFKEFFDVSRKTNANTKNAGVYYIEPEPFKTPLVKVGYSRNLMDGEAKVVDRDGRTVCRFRHEKGIYVSRMKLRAPTPFGGHA